MEINQNVVLLKHVMTSPGIFFGVHMHTRIDSKNQTPKATPKTHAWSCPLTHLTNTLTQQCALHGGFLFLVCAFKDKILVHKLTTLALRSLLPTDFVMRQPEKNEGRNAGEAHRSTILKISGIQLASSLHRFPWTSPEATRPPQR